MWKGLTDPSPEALQEAKEKEIAVMTTVKESKYYETFSSYTRMAIITAWVLRYLNRLRQIPEINDGPVNIEILLKDGVVRKVALLSPSEI